MALAIPPAVNYPSPLQSFAALSQDEPVEGRRQIPVEIDWGTMGQAEIASDRRTVAFNLQGINTVNLRQISALKIDNSGCGADIAFIFPDTNDTIVIPARQPLEVVPVYSNALAFYVTSLQPKSADRTRFQILNFAVSPTEIGVSESDRQIVATTSIINLGAISPIPLITAKYSGFLDALALSLTPGSAGAPAVPYGLLLGAVDGSAVPLLTNIAWSVIAGVGISPIMTVFDQNDMNARFSGGLSITFARTGAWAAGSYTLNMYAAFRASAL